MLSTKQLLQRLVSRTVILVDVETAIDDDGNECADEIKITLDSGETIGLACYPYDYGSAAGITVSLERKPQ